MTWHDVLNSSTVRQTTIVLAIFTLHHYQRLSHDELNCAGKLTKPHHLHAAKYEKSYNQICHSTTPSIYLNQSVKTSICRPGLESFSCPSSNAYMDYAPPIAWSACMWPCVLAICKSKSKVFNFSTLPYRANPIEFRKEKRRLYRYYSEWQVAS